MLSDLNMVPDDKLGRYPHVRASGMLYCAPGS